jgi:hypothetical protein
MHLVGFTIEIYYDARTYERQICALFSCKERPKWVPEYAEILSVNPALQCLSSRTRIYECCKGFEEGNGKTGSRFNENFLLVSFKTLYLSKTIILFHITSP